MITKELADSLAGLLFPRKLWVLANCQDVESIKWGKLGTTVLINSVMVEKECFKPNVFNVQSNQHVLRQMSYYNFQKIDRKCKIWEFKHEHFQAGREDLLHLVKRQPQGVPKKYVEDVERRYSSRLQRRSMKGDRPNYARMEKGDSEGESEKDAQLFERRPSTRSTTKKRPYNRRIVKAETGETPRGTSSTRGRGSRRGGRGRKRTRINVNSQQDDEDESAEDECVPKDRLVIDFDQRKELEYIVPNAENWLYGSLQNGMDGLTIAEDGAKDPGTEENEMQFGINMEVPEDDKSHLKHVIQSTERAMLDARRQQSILANEWSGQSYYGARMPANQNFSWSSPEILSHMDGRYPIVPQGNDSEMCSNGNNYPFFNPHSSFSENPCIPYGAFNLSRSMMNYDLTLPVPIQYSSPVNLLSAKRHSYSESLATSFSEFPGVEDVRQDNNIPRTIDAFDDVFRPHQEHQRAQQKTVDCVTLDHNYNTVKGASLNTFEALEAEFNPLDKTIQSVMQHHESLLAQLIDEQNAERSLMMNELRSRSSGESLQAPFSPHDASDSDHQHISITPRKSSEYPTTSSSGSLDCSTAIHCTGDLTPDNDGQFSSSERVQCGKHGLSPSKADEFDATTVAYFLLESTKYKKYRFTVTESDDILLRDCGDDFNYWRTKKEANPQTLITSPCLQVER